jgi:hypothetical protein
LKDGRPIPPALTLEETAAKLRTLFKETDDRCTEEVVVTTEQTVIVEYESDEEDWQEPASQSNVRASRLLSSLYL